MVDGAGKSVILTQCREHSGAKASWRPRIVMLVKTPRIKLYCTKGIKWSSVSGNIVA